MASPFWFIAMAFFAGFSAQALTGFGAGIITLTIAAQLLPIRALLPLLFALSALMSTYLAVRYRADIDKQLLRRRIIPFAGLGVIFGYALSLAVDGEPLKRLLGVLVVPIALHGLWRAIRRPHAPVQGMPNLGVVTTGLLVTGGLIHGLVATGGPLLAAGMNRAGVSKSAFRTTFAVIWAVCNTCLVTAFAVEGRYDGPTLTTLAALIPVIIGATLAGEWAHRRIPEQGFRVVLMSLLVFAGVLLATR